MIVYDLNNLYIFHSLFFNIYNFFYVKFFLYFSTQLNVYYLF